MNRRPPLLFLAHRIPYPPNKGEKIRAWHFLRGLAQDYTISLGALVDDKADLNDIQAMRDITTDLCLPVIDARIEKMKSLRGLFTGDPLSVPFFYQRKLGQFVEKFCQSNPHSPVFLYSSGMAGYLQHLTATNPLIVDLVDVDSAKWDEYAQKGRFPLRWIYKREGRLLAKTEADLAQKARLTFLVSQAEKDLFLKRFPVSERKTSIHSLENGVDLDYFNPNGDYHKPVNMPLECPLLIFTGAMDYAPNRDAVIWMSKEVLPLIHASGFPQCHFMIVGSKPSPDVQALSGEHITVTGRVPDVRPYLACADIAIAPMRVARGVQNKVLEAMAMAKPTITTPQGFEGIQATAGTDLVIAHHADDIAQAVKDILNNPEKGQRLGHNARQQMQKHYGWGARQKMLGDWLKNALA